MGTLTPRSFLDQGTRWGLGAIAGSTVALGKKNCRAVSPNEKLTLGISRVRGRGYVLARNLAVRPCCQIAYQADVDTSLVDTPAREGCAERVDPSLRGHGRQVLERQKNRQPVVTAQMFRRFPDTVHQDNFLQCIRSRELPDADVREGHLSTLLCQLANISQRLGGQNLQFDPKTESFTNSPEGNKLLYREYGKPWMIADQV
jgi:hypothetical protein